MLSLRGSDAVRGCSLKIPPLAGLEFLMPLSPLSRILTDRALPGEGGCIDFGVDIGATIELCGEPFGLRSSPPPRIADIDIPGRWLLARSRTPANGDAVGGPRGADPRCDDEVGAFWGEEGGGMFLVG